MTVLYKHGRISIIIQNKGENMSKTKSSLTKVAKGVAYGDVSNNAVRNILTEVSKVLYAPFTEDDMVDTMEYFDWCCPYTGRYLKDDYDAKNGNRQSY